MFDIVIMRFYMLMVYPFLLPLNSWYSVIRVYFILKILIHLFIIKIFYNLFSYKKFIIKLILI